MYIYKNLTLKGIFSTVGFHLIWLSIWAILIAILYQFTPMRDFHIPWLPVSLIGTAVSFYVGFKNNQAYDRYWEARKIWGGIINSSRIWGSMVRAYIDNRNPESLVQESELVSLKRKYIHRHIAWVYTLREQLLQPTTWEHQSLGRHIGKLNQRRAEKTGVGLVEKDITLKMQEEYLAQEDLRKMKDHRNAATQMIDAQAQDLAVLRKRDLLDDFRHTELQKVLNDFYDHQGKAERIKKTPLPRQYATVSFIFVCIFIFMFPFAMISEFEKLGDWGVWFSIPFTVIVGWIFVVMELVGDYTENPFEGLANDIPMFSICRTIEIDLLQMLNEKNLPEPEQAKNGVLM